MNIEENNLNMYAIGHGHIDPTWLWRWTEGYEEVRATFRSALDRMEETDAFVFSASSACFYQWAKECDPELFDSIRERIQEGRWEIVGGLWVEPDCNIPCGESFVRHALYSQRFFEREFGRRAIVGFNPDSFGHAGTLPQLLKKAGIEYYVYMRPDPLTEMRYPDGTVFWWEAKDGSRLLASIIPLDYVGGKNIRDKIARIRQYPYKVEGQKHILCFYGVGNHGGGPTKECISEIQAMQREETAGGKITFSKMEDFFTSFLQDRAETSIPVIKNELQHHARGCYSVHSEIKRLNRQVEHALMNAERFATIAWLMGFHPYPQEVFEKCWQDVLYNQFHDILAGTSLETSYEDSRDQLGAARHRADVIANQAIQSIARNIDTSAEGNTIVAFNPLPWPVNTPLIAPPITERCIGRGYHIVNGQEELIPSQEIRGERIDHRRRVFLAQLPAMGYRVFHARSGEKKYKFTLPLNHGKNFIENMWWRIEFDPHTGQITRLYDVNLKLEVLQSGHILAAMVDASDTWSHEVKEYRVEAGRFRATDIRIVEAGEVCVTLRVVSQYDKSQAITEYTLYRDLDHIDCSLRVNWQQQYQTLKLGFETNIVGGVATYEVPYGHQERVANGEEEPGQQWFDLTGTIEGRTYGFAVLNDCKYGFDVRDNVMRITLLRSPAYAHHDNGRFEADACRPIMDQGWHRMKFALAPHACDWRETRIVKRAWELNAPPVVHVESAHPGNDKLQAGLLGTESDNVLLSVIKCSEDGEDIIIRGYETAGKPAETRLHFPYFDKSFDVQFSPHEIKTLRINRNAWIIREVNLLEE
jgi:alpha-mannosidase